MSAEAVFLRRQAYGPALGALFRTGAADAKNPGHAMLLHLISLWVSLMRPVLHSLARPPDTVNRRTHNGSSCWKSGVHLKVVQPPSWIYM